MLGSILGLIGDGLTLLGGLLLAWDAFKKEKEVDKITDIVTALKEPGLANIRFVMEGIQLTDDPKTVGKVFLRRSAKKAKWGCILLVAGFALLVVAKVVQMHS